MIRSLLLVLLLSGPASAQEIGDAPAGVVRWLDKVTGETADLYLARGESVTRGHLTIQLDDCRFPLGNPSSNAYAHVTVTDSTKPEPVFSGWMISSSPALSAMDHPRYDVWILRCDTE